MVSSTDVKSKALHQLSWCRDQDRYRVIRKSENNIQGRNHFYTSLVTLKIIKQLCLATILATSNGYDKDEFKKQMEQLEQQFSRMSIEDKGQRISGKPPEKENITQDFGKTKIIETHLENKPYESRCRVPDNNDHDKDLFIGPVKAMTATLSVPLSSLINLFEGDPRKFQQWIKEVEKFGVIIMDDLQNKHKSDQAEEYGSDETFESEQCENSSRDYEISLNVPSVYLDEDMEIDEKAPKVGLCFKPIPVNCVSLVKKIINKSMCWL